MQLPPVLLPLLGTATLCTESALKAFAHRDIHNFAPIPPGNLTQELSVEVVSAALTSNGLRWAQEITMSDTGFRWVEEKRMAYPFSAMGQVDILNHDGTRAKCSGALVGPRLVATARHCLNIDIQGAYTSHPAFHTTDRLPGATVTHAIYIPHPKSMTNCDFVDDWAIMVLDRDLRETSGYIGARGFDDDVLNHESLHNYGCPGDLESGVPYSQWGFMAKLDHERDAFCSKDRQTPMSHQVDTASGQSGGPIFTAGEHEEGVYLMGINVAVDPNRGRRALASHGTALMGSIVYARRNFT